MTPEVTFFVFVLLCIIIVLCVFILQTSNNNNFNSNYIYSDRKLKNPAFKVCKIEKRYSEDKDGYCDAIAKYTLKSVFAKSNKSLVVNYFILYDEIGKYNIGDEIELVGKTKI